MAITPLGNQEQKEGATETSRCINQALRVSDSAVVMRYKQAFPVTPGMCLRI